MAKFGEMDWEDDNSNKSSEDKKQNNKDSWLRLDAGSNVIRLVTRPHQYVVHKGVKAVGDKGYGQKINCSNPDGKGQCPVCDELVKGGHEAKAGTRWFLGVIDKKNTYKILDISWQVYSAIKNYNASAVWGDPMKYDLDIVVNKNGGPTGYYSVQPIPHKPLSLEAAKARDEADLADLKRRVTPPTPEFVQKRLDKILEGKPMAMPVAKAGAPAGKGNAAPKGKTSPQVSLEDEESVDDIFPSFDGAESNG